MIETPQFKKGQKIEYMGSVLEVQHVRRSAVIHEWVYTLAGIEVSEAALLRHGAKVARKGEVA